MSRTRASYERVEWFHDPENEPRFVYSELDERRYERRKTKVFGDERRVDVSQEKPELGPTRLAYLRILRGRKSMSEEHFTPGRFGVPSGKLATRRRREDR